MLNDLPPNLDAGHHAGATDLVKGAAALAGAAVSLTTLNYIVSVLTVLYLLCMLYVQIPKVISTYKGFRASKKAAKCQKESADESDS